jgi:hypothetical protein
MHPEIAWVVLAPTVETQSIASLHQWHSDVLPFFVLLCPDGYRGEPVFGCLFN